MTQTEDLAQFDPASFEHIPVLLNECLDGLNIDPAGTYLDGTAGGAGHSRQIALRRAWCRTFCRWQGRPRR